MYKIIDLIEDQGSKVYIYQTETRCCISFVSSVGFQMIP